MSVDNTDWAEQVVIHNQAPYGRCTWCNTARSPAGCLNLCEMPAGAARQFQNGLMDVLSDMRRRADWANRLAGCTCEPVTLTGYQAERPWHEYRCPLATKAT